MIRYQRAEKAQPTPRRNFYHTPALFRTSLHPQPLIKKTAPYRRKQTAPQLKLGHGKKGSAVVKSNTNNSSNAAKTNKSSSDGNQASPFAKNNSLFVASPRNYSEISADVVRADCMNHGYRIIRTVGEGAYAKVKLAEVLPSKLARKPVMAEIAQDNGDDTLQVAIKVIENKHVPKEFLKKFLPRELDNHCPLPPNNNVVRVFEQFATTERIYVVMEYCSKGDLLDLINRKISESCKGLGEELARKLFRMMAEGVNHIHHNGIVHRDLKCENILLDRHNTIKITDFGFSTRFEHGKSAFLKTSCGSYAYTAPEVIKMKAYDGIKSDSWSMGVILFAMLNGRLPFNDAQLGELEEDMKMQRLRFERNVSFESMVLVRRILQYTPSCRPSSDEILSDPWLTGKRLIPRQQNKPKWINPYEVNREEGDVAVQTPVYYKGTVADRGPESTVTVNHDKNETVTLKSRTGNKRNIWTSGPPNSHRPNTWPRSEKDKFNTKTKPQRGSVASRGPSAAGRGTKPTIVVRPPTTAGSQKKGQSCRASCKAKVNPKAIKLSKWFMDKYMHGRDCKSINDLGTDCDCCKAEAAETNTGAHFVNDESLYLDEDLSRYIDHDTTSQSPDSDDVRSPSPVKNDPDIASSPDKSVAKPSTKPEQTSEMLVPSKRPEARNCTSASASTSGVKLTASVNRKPAVKSAGVRPGSPKKDADKQPAMSRNPEPTRKCIVNYMVNRSTCPAERIKYFRDRLMKLYDSKPAIPNDGSNGLPMLMVSALKPPTSASQPGSPEPPVTPRPPIVKAPYKRTQSGGTVTWRARRGSSGGTVKPVQRVVVHSSMS